MSEREQVRRNFVVVGTVVFVFIVLVAFLFPVFAKDREGHGPSLLSQVRLQALGIAMYNVDNDDRMPPATSWADAVLPFRNDKSIFEDYMIKGRKKDEFGFAFFRPLSDLITAKISDIEKIPLTFQSKDLSWNANGLLDLLPYRTEKNRGNVVSFVDCHAKFMPESWPAGPITVVIDSSLAKEKDDE